MNGMKKRRDITLGEMQDECHLRDGACYSKDGHCKYNDLCETMFFKEQHGNLGTILRWRSPDEWNLTDPPRFDERQTALLKALWDCGSRKVYTNAFGTIFFYDENGAQLSTMDTDVLDDKVIDLADLFGEKKE